MSTADSRTARYGIELDAYRAEQAFLEFMFRWLKPGGVLVLVIPAQRLNACADVPDRVYAVPPSGAVQWMHRGIPLRIARRRAFCTCNWVVECRIHVPLTGSTD